MERYRFDLRADFRAAHRAERMDDPSPTVPDFQAPVFSAKACIGIGRA
jgi:hypothetical protein